MIGSSGSITNSLKERADICIAMRQKNCQGRVENHMMQFDKRIYHKTKHLPIIKTQPDKQLKEASNLKLIYCIPP